MNKIKIKKTQLVDKTINVPIQINWDYLGLDESVDEYKSKIIEDVIGKPFDFETTRFSHEIHDNSKTEINYEFYFFSGGTLDNINNWAIDYIAKGFTPQEIYYYANNFSNSFFKLDLYDSKDEKTQNLYLTIIIPTQQGLTMETQMQRTLVNLKKPKFILDFVGDKEGFFIYWLKSRDFLDISTFYMSAKFFDAKSGDFIRMMTGSNSVDDSTLGPQTKLGDKFNFNKSDYFYYTVNLNYNQLTYEIYNSQGQRLGTNVPIKWFEYVNP